MPPPFSRSHIDRLGDRLREGTCSAQDFLELDEYRESFGPAYVQVLARVSSLLGFAPTGRDTKSIQSIADKLRRQSIRLSQVQDIAGCRIVVDAIRDQEQVLAGILTAFPSARVEDRRARPNYGYRAVHIIVTVDGWAIEIQLRTQLQDLWAQHCECLADRLDPGLKYGGGPIEYQRAMEELSEHHRNLEEMELLAWDTLSSGENPEEDVLLLFLSKTRADFAENLRTLIRIAEQTWDKR